MLIISINVDKGRELALNCNIQLDLNLNLNLNMGDSMCKQAEKKVNVKKYDFYEET